MNTFALYIEENPNGGITISAECFGEPGVAMEIGESIFASLACEENVSVSSRSVYVQYPDTEHVQ